MKQGYLTISEFAGLRKVSIGSLRYYEKLQILTPARIDPETGYRYYLPEQLGVLDSILSCIALDIPLKELKSYMDESGALDQKSILTRGKQVMQEKLEEMQEKLELTQFNLDRIEENRRYSGCGQLYTRRIGARAFLAEPVPEGWRGVPKKGENRPMELFREAQEKGMAPVFPAGVLLRGESGAGQLCFCFQVLHPDPGDGRILLAPGGDYTCLQADLTSETDMERLLREDLPPREGRLVLISNMLLDKVHFDSLHSEIQMAAEQ
ncbi:MAG: MerR family transcriptional regulator [Oscillospiraceae bacterium]